MNNHLVGHESNILGEFKGARFKCAVDVGANDGLWSEFLADISSFVVCFEPHKKMYGRLLRKMCGRENFMAIPFAVSSLVGPARFYCRECPDHSSLNHDHPIPGTATPIEVESVVNCVSLDGILNGIGLVVDFIKIDTEGTELDVISSAKDVIRIHRPLFCIETHSSESHKEIVEMMANPKVMRYCDSGYVIGRFGI